MIVLVLVTVMGGGVLLVPVLSGIGVGVDIVGVIGVDVGGVDGGCVGVEAGVDVSCVGVVVVAVDV